jgi:quercetin dioxygenase-like cupin family protein
VLRILMGLKKRLLLFAEACPAPIAKRPPIGENKMRIHVCAFTLAAIGPLVLLAAHRSVSQTAVHKEPADIHLFPPDELQWRQGPPSLPKGAMFAVLEGNPNKEGPFLFRIKLPDGYRVPPHTHPKTERVTVISGIFNIGMGDTFDEKATKAMATGAYGYWPPGMKHFVWTKGETILQFHGMGPWSIQYVNPNDDPRKSRE